MTVTTDCVICGNEADGCDFGSPHKESQPICWKCRRGVYELKRQKAKEVKK